MSMSQEEVRSKLDALISQISHEAGDGVVTDWQLAVVSVSTEDLANSETRYTLYGSRMPYHAAYGLAQWTVDAVMNDHEE
jgi:hypothetical protein